MKFSILFEWDWTLYIIDTWLISRIVHRAFFFRASEYREIIFPDIGGSNNAKFACSLSRNHKVD